MRCWLALALGAQLACAQTAAVAQTAPEPPNPTYDAQLAKSVGADDMGMRSYVFVLLKTGPTPMPAGKDRDEMFRGHFANMNRLIESGKLILAGPFDGVEGWRGMFVFAVSDIDEARQLTAADPVIVNGEMVAEYHKHYGSAALMLVPRTHEKVSKKRF